MICAAIDAHILQGRSELHDKLAQQLSFPEWYGKNLDALYDCLTTLPDEATLTVYNAGELESALGRYSVPFMRVLADAQRENPRFRFLLDPLPPPADGE